MGAWVVFGDLEATVIGVIEEGLYVDAKSPHTRKWWKNDAESLAEIL